MEFLTVLKTANQINSFYQLQVSNETITEIWKALKGIYADVAKAHFASATSAFTSAKSSKSPDQEVRNAISHLRDAFYIYETLLTKTKTQGFFIFKHETALLSSDEHQAVRAGLFKVAAIIAISYRGLDESSNAKLWSDQAMNHAPAYASDCCRHMTIDFLRRTNTDFTEFIKGERFSRVDGFTPYYVEQISTAGKEYVEEQKNQLCLKVKTILEAND